MNAPFGSFGNTTVTEAPTGAQAAEEIVVAGEAPAAKTFSFVSAASVVGLLALMGLALTWRFYSEIKGGVKKLVKDVGLSKNPRKRRRGKR